MALAVFFVCVLNRPANYEPSLAKQKLLWQFAFNVLFSLLASTHFASKRVKPHLEHMKSKGVER